MGLVTQTLIDSIKQQVDAHHTVVWFDAEGAYTGVAADSLLPALRATWPAAEVRAYDPERGFFALRRELELLWSGLEQPRLVVYVALAMEETHDALIEFSVCGAVMRPGQHPAEYNTRLADVARQALGKVFPAARVEEIVGEVEQGQLDLAELDGLAAQGKEIQTGVVAVLFGTGNVQEVALRFLADPTVDAAIEERHAEATVASLLSDAFGIDLEEGQGLPTMRAQLARTALATELLAALPEPVPPTLATLALAQQPTARQAAVALVAAWRSRVDLADSYVEWADRIQAELGIPETEFALQALAQLETLRATEELLQASVERQLLGAVETTWVELAGGRIGSFWSRQAPEIKTRWQIVAAAGALLAEAERVTQSVKTLQAADMVGRYAGGSADQAPWCRLDTTHRHLDRDFHSLDPEPSRHDALIKLVALARQRYDEASNELCERFVHAYAEAGFDLPKVTLQTRVYKEVVEPALKQGPTAYILVDALRYEMALELCETLASDQNGELVPVLATPPTITEVGMAALLPGAERGVAVVPASAGKVALVVDGETLRSRKERLEWLQAQAEGSVVGAKLEQVAPLSSIHLREEIKKARLVVVTATEEVDGLWESSPAHARRLMDDALTQLRRGVHVLMSLGIRTVVITADHGYVLGNELAPGQGIEAPGGETADLHRRGWVGKGGDANAAVLRVPLSAFGLSGDLEYATPWGLACFKVAGGSTVYFHGGLSPQEVVVPVLKVTSATTGAPAASGAMAWSLKPGSSKISTRFFSVTVEGRLTELLPAQPPRLRVEIRLGGNVISTPVSASYGFDEATKDVQMRLAEDGRQAVPNTVALMITEDVKPGSARTHLVDGSTGVSLTHVNVPLNIAF